MSNNSLIVFKSIKEVFPTLPKDEIAVYDGSRMLPKIKEFTTNKEINQISDILGTWCVYIGYKVQDNEIIIINQWIRESFPTLTLADLKDIVRRVGISDIKTEYYGSFTPLYVGKCIAEYRPKRAEIIFKINAQLQLNASKNQVLPKESPEDAFITWKKLMLNAKKDAINFRFVDWGNVVYDFLIKNNLIKFTPTLIEEAEAYATEEAVREQTETKTGRGILVKPNKNFIPKPDNIRRLKRQYAVNTWLQSMKDDKFLEFIMKYQPNQKK